MLPRYTLAATFEPTWLTNAPNKVLIIANGPITEGDPSRLMDAMNYAVRYRPGSKIAAIDLDTPGGDVAAGNTLGLITRLNGLDTFLYPGATCASACAVIFFSGKQKIVGSGARIGVHRASIAGSKSENSLTFAVSKQIAETLNSVGVSRLITDKLLYTPANQITWLTSEDLQNTPGIIFGGAPTGSPTDDFTDGWSLGRNAANPRACPDELSQFANGCRAGVAARR